jgi:hypothetical protein
MFVILAAPFHVIWEWIAHGLTNKPFAAQTARCDFLAYLTNPPIGNSALTVLSGAY